MTDADTLANAEELWDLVHLIQDTVDKDGRPLLADNRINGWQHFLKRLRKLADECDPEHGRF